MSSIPFIDLQAQRQRLASKVDDAIAKVLNHGKFIMGPEVQELEDALCQFSGARNTITCANGTDALTLVLMAEGIGSGDVVFVPSFTFIATAESPAQLGATPFFVDVREDTFNIDPQSLKAGIKQAKKEGLNPRCVIAVDLFGLPADYDVLKPICDQENLILIGDAAQSFGASYKGSKVGTLADYTTTSFFPAKPFGCYGDGGAVFTKNDKQAAKLRSLRVHGKGTNKYDNVRVGLNSRLDTIQAAILLEKLKIFPDELKSRQRVAQNYTNTLHDKFNCPILPDLQTSAWAQYTLRCEERKQVQNLLDQEDIPHAIYYPIPLHKQAGYRHFPKVLNLGISEQLSEKVISLPMHPYLDGKSTEKILNALLKL